MNRAVHCFKKCNMGVSHYLSLRILEVIYCCLVFNVCVLNHHFYWVQCCGSLTNVISTGEQQGWFAIGQTGGFDPLSLLRNPSYVTCTIKHEMGALVQINVTHKNEFTTPIC